MAEVETVGLAAPPPLPRNQNSNMQQSNEEMRAGRSSDRHSGAGTPAAVSTFLGEQAAAGW